MLVFLIGLGALGVWGYTLWQAKVDARTQRYIELERQIIRVAVLRNGRITALDVATRGPESVTEIEQCLRNLQSNGYCDSELTEDGQHLYIFRSFDDTPVRIKAIEKEIFRLAKTCNGIVKVSDVVLRTELSYEEAREWFENMVMKNICKPYGHSPETYSFVNIAANHGSNLNNQSGNFIDEENRFHKPGLSKESSR